MDRLFGLFQAETVAFQQSRIDEKTVKKKAANKHYNPPKMVIQQSLVNVDHILDLDSKTVLTLLGD